MTKCKLLYAICGLCLFIACQQKPRERLNLIPQVDSICVRNGYFQIQALKTIQIPAKWEKVGKLFIKDLSEKSSIFIQLTNQNANIKIIENPSLPAEAYQLNIKKDFIQIEANDIPGLNHALVTLQQLIWNSTKGLLPELTITDHPRFSYRGIMLDCSRHFWEISELKKTIDQMAFFKLNTLHLHLTDNQGWRFAIDKYPQLTKKGSYYYDYPELSGKYYSKSDLKDLVNYASLRGITIIPEIDLPGHCISLLAGLPELSCQGGIFETYPEEREANKRKYRESPIISFC